MGRCIDASIPISASHLAPDEKNQTPFLQNRDGVPASTATIIRPEARCLILTTKAPLSFHTGCSSLAAFFGPLSFRTHVCTSTSTRRRPCANNTNLKLLLWPLSRFEFERKRMLPRGGAERSGFQSLVGLPRW